MDELEKKDTLEQKQENGEPAPQEIDTAGEIAEETIEETKETAEQPAQVETAKGAADMAAEGAAPPAEEKKKKSSLPVILLVLAVLIGVGVYYWQTMQGDGNAVQDTGVLYAKNDDLYFYDLENEPYLLKEGISAGGSYHYYYSAWGASCAEEGHWAYFSDNIDESGCFDLYRKDTADAAAEPVLIDSNVYDYMTSKNGEVAAYLAMEGDSLKLRVYNGENVQEMAEGIHLENGVYSLSGDGKYLVFKDAYGMLRVAKAGEKETLPLTDAVELYELAEEGGMLYFVAKGTEGYNIYSYAFDGADPVLVAENVSYMELMPNGKDLLYCKTPTEQVLYKDIVVDDMAEADAALTEADGEAYEKKLQRDVIRKAMENGEGFAPLLQECYMLIDGKSVLVSKDVVSTMGVDSEQPYAAGYRAKEFTPLHLSVIDGGLDMVEYIYFMSLSYGGLETFLADGAGNAEALTGSNIQPDSLQISPDGKRAAYLTEDPNSGGNILMVMEIGKAAEATAVQTNVENFGFVGSSLYFYFDYENGAGTLAAEGVEQTIPDACGIQYTDEGAYYIADVDSTTGNGQLKFWDGMEETVIDSGVFAFQYKNNGKLVYISSYEIDGGAGDLYYYDGEGSRKLDTDVTAIFMY